MHFAHQHSNALIFSFITQCLVVQWTVVMFSVQQWHVLKALVSLYLGSAVLDVSPHSHAPGSALSSSAVSLTAVRRTGSHLKESAALCAGVHPLTATKWIVHCQSVNQTKSSSLLKVNAAPSAAQFHLQTALLYFVLFQSALMVN